MKKKLFLLLFLFAFFSFKIVYASPITYSRTSDDLRLPKNVDVGAVNVDEVMKIPAVDSKAKIYDFADLLTDAEEAKIFIQLNEYINHTGFDAIIVTTNDIQGFELKDYIYKFYDYNDFLDDGVSFIIYVQDENKSIFMGNNGIYNSDIFRIYPNANVTEILKYVYTNHIDQGDFAGACDTYITLIDGLYLQKMGSYKNQEEGSITSFPWVEIIIISFVLTFIIVVLIVTKHQKRPSKADLSIKNALNTTTMIVKCEYDNPILEKNIRNS